MKKTFVSVLLAIALCCLAAMPAAAFTITAGTGVTCTTDTVTTCTWPVTGYGSSYCEAAYTYVAGDDVMITVGYITTARSLTAPYYPMETNPVSSVLEPIQSKFPAFSKNMGIQMPATEGADRAVAVISAADGTSAPAGTGSVIINYALPGVKQ